MTAQELINETIEFTINWMVRRLQDMGYSQEQIAQHMSSEAGMKEVLHNAQTFLGSLAPATK